MNTQTNQYIPRIVRGRVELWVPHQESEIAFAYPSTGPDTYQTVGNEILKTDNLPTADQTASLLYAGYCSDAKDEPEFQNVREIMKERWLWVFNGNLWTNKGVYVFADGKAEGRDKKITVNELEKMVGEGTARFAPKETYTFGEQTPQALSKNGFVIAGYGEEGAEKLGEVSAQFKYNPYVYGVEVNKGPAPELRVSALVDIGGWLRVDGNGFDLSQDGLAFGVFS